MNENPICESAAAETPMASPPVEESAPSSWLHGWFGLGIQCLFPILLFGAWLLALPFGLVDDAFIPMVYARNLVQGHGLVFYPGGERVEGFTSPAWTTLLALFQSLGFPLPSMAYASGIVCGLGVLFFTVLLYRWIFEPQENAPVFNAWFWPMAAAMAVVSDAAFPAWSASGMETALYTLLLLMLIASLYKGWNIRISALMLLALSLIRPEGPAFLLPAVIIHLSRRNSFRSIIRSYSLYFLLPLAALFIFRLAYFGYAFPNSFYAKHDYGGLAIIDRGINYIITYFQPRPIFGFVLLCFAWKGRDNRRSCNIVLMFVLTHIFLVIAEGGDHFALHRFMVPALPLLSILFIRGVQLCFERLFMNKMKPSRLRLAQSAAVIFVMILLISNLIRIFEYRADDEYHFSKRARWMLDEAAWAKNWSQMGKWLKEKYPPGTVIAVMTAGAIPYYSELNCIDMAGINDVTIAHTPASDLSRHFAGHEKSNVNYVLSRQPRFIQLFPLLFFNAYPYPENRLERLLYYPAQQDLWHHPLFHETYGYNTEETTYGYISYFERLQDADGR
ncbi:MAG: hypothetical protein AB1656_20255 [Candidatus Omnitrophota bacterium]